MGTIRRNSLEAQLAEAEAKLAERDAKLKAWDEGPEGQKLKRLESAEKEADDAATEANNRLWKLEREVGWRLGVMNKADANPSPAMFAQVRKHVGLGSNEPLDAMPQMNSFRGSRETGERMLRHAAHDLMNMIIAQDPEIAKASKEADRFRTAAREMTDLLRKAQESRNAIKCAGEYWRIEFTIREIKERIAKRDSQPLTRAENPLSEADIDRLRKIRDDLATLADWARGNKDAKPAKPFTWVKP